MSKKFINLANETQASTVQGTALTNAYTNLPVLFAEEIIDAAKKKFFFANFVNTVYLAEGHHDYVVKKRTKYLGREGVTFDTGEATTSDISNTSLSTLDGVQLTPVVYTSRFTTTNYAIRTNAFNIVAEAKAELSEAIGSKVDYEIAQAFGDATDSDNTTQGALSIYANDRDGTDNLAAGDILTPDMIAKAARYLKDSTMYYNNSGTITKASTTKNPWSNEPDDPFVLFIGPAQEMQMRQDSQFTNASEYGSNEVVQNGEIGKYLGIRIVVTDNVESFAAGATAPDGNTAAVDGTLCILAKPKKAVTLCWGQEPVIDTAPIQWRKQTSIVLETAYDIKVVHDDAIVKIYVANE
ncbi:MAG: N4-gp56 family major capsid protein [Candidatus Heimdallarchaeaceae archaeon]